MKKINKDRRLLLKILFFAYLLIMLYLLFFRSFGKMDGLSYTEQLRYNSNWKPFLTIRNYLYVIIHRSNPPLIRHCLINLLGNILLFIPAGILLPAIYPRQHNFFLFLATCFGSILLVEILQLLTLLGSFDVDDIILNLSGMILGYLLWFLCSRIRK